jgi:hypothetical protein
MKTTVRCHFTTQNDYNFKRKITNVAEDSALPVRMRSGAAAFEDSLACQLNISYCRTQQCYCLAYSPRQWSWNWYMNVHRSIVHRNSGNCPDAHQLMDR